MGFSDSDSCKRHPNTRQVPGVCSSCLREKLSKLGSSPYNRTTPSTASPSPSLSSSSPANYSSASSSSATAHKSPPAAGDRSLRSLKGHRRNGSSSEVNVINGNNYVSVGFVLNDGKHSGLKKSKSVACAPRFSTGGGGGVSGGSSRRLGSLRESVASGFRKEKDQTGKPADKWKSGFWSRLVHSSSKKAKGVLMHSKSTMNERSSRRV